MKNNHITWFGRYEGYLRMIARGVRDGDAWSIECAAKLFDLMLPTGAVVVPMPGHLGHSDQMHDVAVKLHERRDDIVVCEMLRCKPHESNYSQKKYSTPVPVEMYVSYPFNQGISSDGVFVIDNVICTGVTASAALEVLPNATVVALAVSNWR